MSIITISRGSYSRGKDTWDSRLYDMVLCVDSLCVDDIVEILATAVRKEQFQATQESQTELQKRLLLANIQARISSNSPNTKMKLMGGSSIELSRLDGRLRNSQNERE